jgi:hypothetical protein
VIAGVSIGPNFGIEKLSTRAVDTSSAARLRYAASLCRAAPFMIAAPFSAFMTLGNSRHHHAGAAGGVAGADARPLPSLMH